MESQPWEQLPNESGKAYAAFLAYMRLPIESRSIDMAWDASGRQQTGIGKRAARQWFSWSAQYNWLARATAHDAYLIQIEQDEYDTKWLERKRLARERDWEQADKLRVIIDDALPHAQKFIHSQRSFIEGKDGSPDREVITLSFDITGLTNVLMNASKLQRLTNDESTDNIQLSGAALDAAIARELEKLADPSQKAIADSSTAAVSTDDSL